MVDKEKAGEAIHSFLEALGLDLTELDMEKTPQRVADMYAYLFNGLGKDTKHIWGELFPAENDSIVAVKNIPFYSMCEHHLVPFLAGYPWLTSQAMVWWLGLASLPSWWNCFPTALSCRNG